MSSPADKIYYSAPTVGLPDIKHSAEAASPSTARRPAPKRIVDQHKQPNSARKTMPDRFNTKGSSRMVVERLRPDRNKDISEVVARGDFMHKGRAAPSESRRRTNNINNQFDIKNKNQLRDDLLPDADFVKRVFYTIANRQGGVIDATQFEESASVVFGRVRDLDVEQIPQFAHMAHALMMHKLPHEKKMTLENFHVSLVAAGYFLMMKPLMSIRKFGTAKEFGFLAKNLGLDSVEDALAELDPNGTGRFDLNDFVWWAANKTAIENEFTLDLLPLRALSVTAAKKPAPEEVRVSHAMRCAVSPRLAALQKERDELSHNEAFGPLDPNNEAMSSTSNSNTSPTQQRVNLPPMEQQQPSTPRRQPIVKKVNSPRVVAFGQSTPRRQSVLGQQEDDKSNTSSRPSSSAQKTLGSPATVAVVVASPASPLQKSASFVRGAGGGEQHQLQQMIQQRKVGRRNNHSSRHYPGQGGGISSAAEMMAKMQQEEEEEQERQRAAAAEAASKEEQQQQQQQQQQQLFPPIRSNPNSVSPRRTGGGDPLFDSLAGSPQQEEQDDFNSTEPARHQQQQHHATATSGAGAGRRYPGQPSSATHGTQLQQQGRRLPGNRVVRRRNLPQEEDSSNESQQEAQQQAVQETQNDEDEHPAKKSQSAESQRQESDPVADDSSSSAAASAAAFSGAHAEASNISHHEFNYDHLPQVQKQASSNASPAGAARVPRVAIGGGGVKKQSARVAQQQPQQHGSARTKGRYQSKRGLQEIL